MFDWIQDQAISLPKNPTNRVVLWLGIRIKNRHRFESGKQHMKLKCCGLGEMLPFGVEDLPRLWPPCRRALGLVSIRLEREGGGKL